MGSSFERKEKEKAKEEKKRAREIEEMFRKLTTAPWAEDTKLREEILNKFREIGQPVLEKIIEMSKSDSWRTCREAMKLLGGLGAIKALWLLEDERGEELLIQALKDEAELVRVEGVHSLILIEEAKKTGKAIPAVIHVLENDKNPNIRADTATCLAFIKWDPRVTEALIQALYDKEKPPRPEIFGIPIPDYTKIPMSVQEVAAHALAKIGVTKEVIAEYFNQGLKVEKIPEPSPVSDEKLGIERAAEILAYCNELGIGDAQPVKPLINALKTGDPQVRSAAAEALGNKKDVKVIEPLAQALNDESRDVRSKAIEALGKIGEPAIETLIQALKHKETVIRQSAAYALGDIGDIRALEALTQAKEDKSWWVRSAAKGTLKKIQKKQLPRDDI